MLFSGTRFSRTVFCNLCLEVRCCHWYIGTWWFDSNSELASSFLVYINSNTSRIYYCRQFVTSDDAIHGDIRQTSRGCSNRTRIRNACWRHKSVAHNGNVLFCTLSRNVLLFDFWSRPLCDLGVSNILAFSRYHRENKTFVSRSGYCLRKSLG